MKREKNGGRVAGTPNKTTKEMRSILTDFANNYYEGAFWEDFQNADSKDRMDFFAKILPFVTPKFQAVQMDMNANVTARSIEDKLKELSKIEKEKGK